MDIKNLAAEMDLTCINAYKLDALKSVFHGNETTDAGVRTQNNKELDVGVENAGSFRFTNGDMVTCTTDKCKSDVFTETGMSIMLCKIFFGSVYYSDYLDV